MAFTTSVVIVAGFLLGTAGFAAAAAPPVTAVAFTPDGKAVLTGSQGGIGVWEWPALKPGRTLPTTLQHVHDLAFSPDGKWLLAAGGIPAEQGAVELYAWPAEKRVGLWKDHGDLVWRIAWRPDSSGWVTAGLDDVLRVYDLSGRKSLRVLRGHSRGVKAVGILPDGRTAVSGGLDNSLRVWSLKSGRALRSFDNHTKPIHDLAVRPRTAKDTPPMVVTLSEDRTVRLWQPTIGRMVRFRRLKAAVPLCVRWSRDGSRIIVGCSDGRVRVIDPDTVAMVQEAGLLVGWAYSLDVSPDGTMLVVGGSGGVVQRMVLKRRSD